MNEQNKNQSIQQGKNQSSAQKHPESYWNAGRRVFFLWALIILVGFIGTHLHQDNPDQVNILWAIASLVGLAYMKKQMSFEYPDLKKIFLVWFWIIVLGLIVSVAAFYWAPLYSLAGYLGIFWLVIMALGHAATGIIDKKSVYITTTGIQLLAAIVAYYSFPLYVIQYLVAGLVGSLAMIWLVLYA